MPVIIKQNRPSLFGRDCVLAADFTDLSGFPGESWAITGAPATVDTPWGRALDFDGTNDYITLNGTGNFIDFTGEFSFELFVLAEVLTGPHYLLMQGQFNVSGVIVSVSATGLVNFYTSQGGAWQRTTSVVGTITTDTWYHIVVTRNGNTGSIYVNGTETAYAFVGVHVNPVASANPYRVAVEFVGGNQWNGLIKYVRMYRRELPVADVLQNYNMIIGAV